jgi:hypothetical protein
MLEIVQVAEALIRALPAVIATVREQPEESVVLAPLARERERVEKIARQGGGGVL